MARPPRSRREDPAISPRVIPQARASRRGEARASAIEPSACLSLGNPPGVKTPGCPPQALRANGNPAGGEGLARAAGGLTPRRSPRNPRLLGGEAVAVLGGEHPARVLGGQGAHLV